MKKFFLSLLVLIIAFTGISQTPYPTPFNPFGSRGTMTNAQGGWKVDSTFILPAYSDTNSANRQKTSLYPGSLIRVGNVIYQRSSDTTYWILVGGGSSLCPGTQLLSGSITWSGSGLVYDATDLEYYILCLRYSSSATTITLTAANPSFDRIDKFYADNTGNVGVITGTPAANPQEPAVNPLTQIDLGIVYVPAGSLVPAGTTQTIIYNENVEWSGTSDVPSINFAYGTNPYTGSVSTYVPSAPNSSYIEWAGGSDYNFSQAQYLKFWVRLNANFSTEPLSFLDVTFEYTDVTVSQTLAVGNGDFNMDYSLINQWQLVSIPLTGITTYGATFNEVHFVINSAPSSFQLDYVYLLETNTVPPVVGDYWGLQGNSVVSLTNPRLGTTSDNDLTIIAGDSVGIVVPSRGVTQSADTSHKQLLWDSTTKKLYWGYQPTILADSPVVIYQSGFQDRIKVDTTDATPTALATQYDLTQSSNGWGLTGNPGTNPATNFIGPTDNVDFIFKRAGNIRGRLGIYNVAFGTDIELGTGNTGFGDDVLVSSTANTNYNTGIGYAAMQVLDNGENNVAAGYNNLITLTDGNGNTAIGANADVSTPSTDSSVAIGYQATASTKQVAFSPHLTTMFLDLDSASGTAPAIAGIDANGNWRKYATPSGGSGSVLTGNLAYVDAVNGNDGTGTLGDFTKPYLTPLAAFTAATTGYTIVVRPGIYLLSSLDVQMLKDSVNWYFMPGAIFVANAASSGTMFSDNLGAVNCSVTGYGQFYDTLGGISKILEVSSSGSNIYFECQSITAGDGDIDHGIIQSDGNLNAYVRGSIISRSYDAISIVGGVLNLTADSLIASGASEGNAIEVGGGTVNIKCTGYRSVGAYDAFGSTSAIFWYGGNLTIEGNGIAELSDGIFINQTTTGTLNLKGKLKSTARTAVIYDAGTSNKTFINQATLISNTSYDSIDAPSAQTVISYGTFANKAVDANITINGILTIGSYVQ